MFLSSFAERQLNTTCRMAFFREAVFFSFILGTDLFLF